MGSGMWVVIGVLSALLRRAQTGKGGVVGASLFETALGWMVYHATAHAATGEDPKPQGSGSANGQANLRPSSRRNREFLEGFSLDTLRMVGTFKVGSSFYGLVQSKDGLVHKVQPGNYLGQNDGKVTEITGGKISLVEIIPDGLGGYIERPASLALSD